MSRISYAGFSDVDDQLSRAETDARMVSKIETALATATDKLIHELGFDFFQRPSVGTAIRLLDANGGRVLHAHSGIVSVSLIRTRPSRSSDWVELETTDYDLEAKAALDPNQTVATSEPFDHIRLNGTGTAGLSWPRGLRVVEITGVFGWPEIPQLAIDANVEWARQDIAADRTFPGGVQVPSETGFPPQRLPLPDSVIRLRQWALYRYSCDT